MGFQYAGPLPPSHPGWLSNSRTFGAPNHTCGLLLYREDLLVPFSRSDLKTEFMPSLPRSYLKCQQSETAPSAIMGFQNCASAVDHTHAGWEYSESSLVSPTICRPPQGHHPRPPKLPPKTPKYMACNFHHLTSRDFNEARESEAAKMAAPPLVKGYGDPYGPTVPAIMQPGYRQDMSQPPRQKYWPPSQPLPPQVSSPQAFFVQDPMQNLEKKIAQPEQGSYIPSPSNLSRRRELVQHYLPYSVRERVQDRHGPSGAHGYAAPQSTAMLGGRPSNDAYNLRQTGVFYPPNFPPSSHGDDPRTSSSGSGPPQIYNMPQIAQGFGEIPSRAASQHSSAHSDILYSTPAHDFPGPSNNAVPTDPRSNPLLDVIYQAIEEYIVEDGYHENKHRIVLEFPVDL